MRTSPPLIAFFGSLTLLASCAPIGPLLYDLTWDCGAATETTTYASCVGVSYPNENLKFKGSVKPVNYGDAVPHGWGVVTSNSETLEKRIRFQMGDAVEVSRETTGDGSSYSGKIDRRLRWTEGELTAKKYTFLGEFDTSKSRTAEGFRWKRGRVTWSSGETFNGSFQYFYGDYSRGNNFPLHGTYRIPATGCSTPISVNARFKVSPSPSAIDRRYDFALRVNGNQANWNSNKKTLEIGLASGEKIVLDKVDFKEDQYGKLLGISSAQEFLKYNSSDGEVAFYSISWAEPLDCSNQPKLAAKSTFLPATSDRVAIYNAGANGAGLRDLGFRKATQHSGAGYGQLFIVNTLEYAPERKVTRSYQQTSRYISSSYQKHNPAYDVARLEVERAARDLATEEKEVAEFNANCAGSFWECVLASAIIDDTDQLESNLKARQTKLKSTPTTITEKIYSDYSIEKLDITASKSGSVVVALIDFDRGVTYLDEIPFNETQKFTVVNSPIHSSDSNASSIKRGSTSEREIDLWMIQPPKFDKELPSLLLDLVSSNRPKEVEPEVQLLQAKNWSVGKRMPRTVVSENSDFSEDPFTPEAVVSRLQKWYDDFTSGDPTESPSTAKKAVASNYQLEDSIVVVETLSGSGSGFYVSPKQVLTNAHVVGDSNFVQMRDFAGRQTTGEVIKKDLGSDLALVSVSRSATPLRFSRACKVNRREEVFTIGHPRGYEYSTTRGIVSSVRKMENPFVRVAGEFRYVQIDAPISPGNSGGPLFNGSEEVIGVNTFTNSEGQNLNFAVHCEEIMRFLK